MSAFVASNYSILVWNQTVSEAQFCGNLLKEKNAPVVMLMLVMPAPGWVNGS